METTIDTALGRTHNSDCLVGLGSLPPGSVDLVFADPPFNIGYEYDVYHDRKEKTSYLDWSRDWITLVHRVLKPIGTFWLAIGDEYAAELKITSQEIGFTCRSWVIWYYTFGVNCDRKFTRSHAHLFHFVKDPKTFTFRAEEPENRVPSARQLVYNDGRANPRGRLPDDTWILRPQDLIDGFTPGEDTWYFPRVAGTFRQRAGFHGCQMPEQLLGRIIRTCSHENEIVLDPFSGSASTLIVAKKLGRRCLGFELSPEYVRLATERLDQTRLGDPLEGDPEPTLSAPRTNASPRRQDRQGNRLNSARAQPDNQAPRPSDESPISAALDRGLIDAFKTVSKGYSLDRVIADRELNEALGSACRSLGLPGDRTTWNTRLFRMRKAGKLADVSTEKRTEIPWPDCDRFLFASEIAWNRMLKRGYPGLDDILCNPRAADEFDEIARRYSPGFKSLEYRWGALKLRKEARRRSLRSEVLVPVKLNRTEDPRKVNFRHIPAAPGLYVIIAADGQSNLYCGETLNLRTRLEHQFQQFMQGPWATEWHATRIDYELAVDQDCIDLLSHQAALVKKLCPLLNCPGCSAA
jgi:site-specific DNA-methyltransferase (adenine-specific)